MVFLEGLILSTVVQRIANNNQLFTVVFESPLDRYPGDPRNMRASRRATIGAIRMEG
jgi:hypothetical protein